MTCEAPVHLSNLMIIGPATDHPTRIGIRRGTGTDGTPLRVRYARRSGQPLDNP